MKKNLFLLVIAVCIGNVLVNAQDLATNPSVFPVAERDNTYVQKNKISVKKQNNGNALRVSDTPQRIPGINKFLTPGMVWVMRGDEKLTEYINEYNEALGTAPYHLEANIFLESPVKVRPALYIPKAEFLDRANKRLYLQGFGECPDSETDYTNFQKIYEFPALDVHKSGNGDYYETGDFEYNWSAMTQAQFTGGVSRPVFDCVAVAVENADTGEIIDMGPIEARPITHYYTGIGEDSMTYTALPDSVVADFYFATGKHPVKDITVYLVDYDCVLSTMRWDAFQVSGEEALFSSSSVVDHLVGYQVLDPAQYLEDEESGLYHVSWKIIGLDGKPFRPDPKVKYNLGLIVSGPDNGNALNISGREGLFDYAPSHYLPSPTGTGITTPKQSNNIKIAARSNSLVIDTGNSPVGGICRVYTTNGVEVMQQALTQPVTQIGRFAIGTYIVEVKTGTETKTEKVFVCGCIR
jgi:hypothetical protein